MAASFVSRFGGLLFRSGDFVAIRAGSIRQVAAWNDKIGIPQGLNFFGAISAVLANGVACPPRSAGEGLRGHLAPLSVEAFCGDIFKEKDREQSRL
jgi:hypothetical protein